MSDKPCDECPEQKRYSALNGRGELDFTQMGLPQVYYFPNHPHNPLQDLQYTLPPFDTIAREFSKPHFYEDGSIEYPRLSGANTPPDDIDGYRRDDQNEWKFHPLWPPCAMRMQGTRMKQSGCIDVKMACNHPSHPKFQRPVKYDDCAACTVRAVTLPEPPAEDQAPSPQS